MLKTGTSMCLTLSWHNRAMPHCCTKYSPYYLVFGRVMHLPIEDDWKPRFSTKDLEDNEYEKHVELLAKRLHKANKVAGQ